VKKVDGYLSRKAQAAWPTAIIWKEQAEGNGVDRYILERQGEVDVLLGNVFGEAKAGLDALLASARSRKALENKEES
jgi:hypothetical protein